MHNMYNNVHTVLITGAGALLSSSLPLLLLSLLSIDFTVPTSFASFSSSTTFVVEPLALCPSSSSASLPICSIRNWSNEMKQICIRL